MFKIITENCRISLSNVRGKLQISSHDSSNFSNTYSIEGFEILRTVFVYVVWLVSEDLAREIVQKIWEILRHWVLRNELTDHFIFLLIIICISQFFD